LLMFEYGKSGDCWEVWRQLERRGKKRRRSKSGKERKKRRKGNLIFESTDFSLLSSLVPLSPLSTKKKKKKGKNESKRRRKLKMKKKIFTFCDGF